MVPAEVFEFSSLLNRLPDLHTQAFINKTNLPPPTKALAGMESTGREAEPIAKGTIATAKQSFRDLFRWEQRVEISNVYGETWTEWQRPKPLQNPFSLVAQLSPSGWLFFLFGFAAWSADAFDFHALSIQTTKIADYYNVTNTDVSTAITLTLLLRSVGAAFFGRSRSAHISPSAVAHFDQVWLATNSAVNGPW